MSIEEKVYNWEGKTILVADDLVINFRLIELLLRKTKVNMIWAKNGLEALEVCKTNPNVDLVLMDVQMPFMNGYEATRAIKAIRSDLPVIAQTAFTLSGEPETSLSAGCDDYVAKPIKRELFLALIDRYLFSEK